MNRWYNVHDALPAIDAECIVLNDKGRISFAHMVDKNVAVDYDGWNSPNVVWWTHFEPSEELEEYYGQNGNTDKPKRDNRWEKPAIIASLAAQIDFTIVWNHLFRLIQNDRACFERIILDSLQFLDQDDVVEHLSTATLSNELLYRERKERLNKPKED